MPSIPAREGSSRRSVPSLRALTSKNSGLNSSDHDVSQSGPFCCRWPESQYKPKRASKFANAEFAPALTGIALMISGQQRRGHQVGRAVAFVLHPIEFSISSYRFPRFHRPGISVHATWSRRTPVWPVLEHRCWITSGIFSHSRCKCIPI